MAETLVEREKTVEEEFALFDDWMGRYEYLIHQGKALPLIEDAYKDDAHRIHGCQSQVWVRAELKDGRVWFRADSDAQITKGLVALLVRVLSGLTPEEIVAARLDFIHHIGLEEHLSPTRKNGLAGMVVQMKRYAAGYLNGVPTG